MPLRSLIPRLTTLLCWLLATLPGLPSAQAASPPNIILIFTDDMPWFGTPVPMDPSNTGSSMGFLRMPNVERLARQGMVFRNARSAAAMCAPSRCSLQTGMMTAHHLFTGNSGFGPATDGTVKYVENPKNTTSWLFEPQSQGNLRFPSIGDVLRQSGYATAHFGKWHLYGGGPALHGYDESDGETTNSEGLVKDPVTGRVQDTCADPKRMFSITESGLNFMERSVKAQKPFYLQLSHYATHARFQSRPETLKKYENDPRLHSIEDPVRRHSTTVFAAMCEDLDTTVGLVFEKLERLGIEKNTYLFFTSDNGHRWWNESFTDLLRGDKWWLWDMGLRVPLLVQGPGIEPGSRSPVNVVGYDFLPTFAELAGAKQTLPKAVDGVSFVPVLLGQPLDPAYTNRPLLFHYPHHRVSAPASAIVQGDLKLLHFYQWPGEYYLCNLAEDLGENRNLTPSQPQLAQQLYEQMRQRLQSVGAYFPKPNPNVKTNAYRYNPNDPDDRAKERD